MKKNILFLFMMPLFFTVYAQHDTIKPDSSISVYHNVEYQHFKDILVGSPSLEVLIIDGDSLYNMVNPHEFRNKVEADDRSIRIIENPDTIQKIIGDRIKSLIIITKKE